MTTRWEYLSMVLERRVEKRTREKFVDIPSMLAPDESVTEEYFHYTNMVYIWRPGAEEAEEHETWSTGMEKNRVTPLSILNELGAEGWELVDRSVQSSASGPSRLGWINGGWAVETLWTLKRPLL